MFKLLKLPVQSGSKNSALKQKQELTAHKLSLCSTAEARACLPYEIASELQVLPLGILSLFGREMLTVATAEPDDNELSAAVRFAAGREIKTIRVPTAILPHAIFAAYHGDPARLTQRLDGVRRIDSAMERREREVPFQPPSGEAAHFLAALIEHALALDASDIHLIPVAGGTRIRLRVKGSMLSHEDGICSLAIHHQMTSRLKVLAGLDCSSRSKPQEGSFSVPLAGQTARVRVSIMPTVHGEKAVLRLLGPSQKPDLDTLGIPPAIHDLLLSAISRRQGAILFAGATGSGKTTSMYALLQRLAEEQLSLVTIEDPVEIQLPQASQTAIDEKTGLTYAACLKAALRQDPDVILLGEIRDAQSALIALEAALTGHLLLSTVHARNVFEVFLRLRNFGVDPLTIAQTVELVVCQMLLPKLCDCKVAAPRTIQPAGGKVFRAGGCELCSFSGFSGRVLAAEAFRAGPGLRQELAGERIGLAELRNNLDGSDYHPMSEALRELLHSGTIAVDDYKLASPE